MSKKSALVASPPPQAGWSFLTNHTHVLVCLSRDPTTTVRGLSTLIGITERSVQRILGELEAAGAITRERHGRRNRYTVHRSFRLRHSLEADRSLGELLDAVG